MSETLNTFLGIPEVSPEKAKFIILPLPYEVTTSYVRGTVAGPQAILAASAQLELYDEELQRETYQQDIHTVLDLLDKSDPLASGGLDFKQPPQEFLPRLTEYAKRFIKKDKILVSFGGEHSITFGLVKAFKDELYPNLSVLQLDAHDDLYDEFEGWRYGHASVMRRVSEICPVTQVGIRSVSEEYESIQTQCVGKNINTFFAHAIRPISKYIKQILNSLGSDVYITLDVDVFDPATMPGVGTPEPGGLDWYEVLDVLRPVFKQKNVVGFDIVELCPVQDSVISDFTAAKLVYRMMGYASKTRSL